MRYSEGHFKQLRDRWNDPFVDPDTEEKTTFGAFLRKRLKRIEKPLIKEIGRVDGDLQWGKMRMVYPAAWENVAEEIFRNTLERIEKGGLRYRDEVPGGDIDLRGAPLAGVYFKGAWFYRANLDGANCKGAHFEGALCEQANFSGANCRGARFSGTYCPRACFDNAICMFTRFEGAALVGAGFDKAMCDYASFDSADMRFANFVRSRCLRARFIGANCKDARFERAYCERALFDNAYCENAHFTGANFDYTSFSASQKIKDDNRIRTKRTYLGGVIFTKATFIGVDITQVDWSKNPRMKRYIEQQQFVKAIRDGANNPFKKVLFWLWEATSNCGQSFFRWMAFSALIIIFFAGIFTVLDYSNILGCDVFDIEDSIRDCPVYTPRWAAYIYFSIVTFSTLGFGDVIPTNWITMIAVAIEVIFGYIMLGGLITFLANWLGRK